MIDSNDIKKDKMDALVIILQKQGHTLESYNNIYDFIDDLLGDNIEYGGDYLPYIRQKGPTLDHSGGEPAEGGYFEDIFVQVGGVCISEFIKDSGIEAINQHLMEGE